MNKESVVVGIDPGKTGAMAILAKDGRILDIKDFSDGGFFKADECLKCIKCAVDVEIAILEKVGSMPRQGITSAFNFGVNFGGWQGLLISNSVPFSLVTPQKWMKGQIKPSDHEKVKKRGLTVCRRLYPGSDWFRLEKHDGRADAVLMARYAINELKKGVI